MLSTAPCCVCNPERTRHTLSVGHEKLLDQQDKHKKKSKYVSLSMRACPVSTLHVLLLQAYLRWLCTSIYQCSEIGSVTSLMHVTQVHPVSSENQFHCTRLYTHVLTFGTWKYTLMYTDTHHTYAHGHINAWQGVCPWHCKCRTIFALIRRWMHLSKQLSLCFVQMENLMV